MWKDLNIRKLLYQNRYKYLGKFPCDLSDRELLRGFKISGIHRGYSHFSPLWFKEFIELNKPQCVYDPCGGWGHRLLGSFDTKYIYNDNNYKTCNGIKNIIQMFDIKNTTVYTHDCSVFVPDDIFDCVFTCPPYFNTEVYTVPFESFEQYMVWWESTIKRINREGVRLFGLVINQEYKIALVDVLKKYGWVPKSYQPLSNSVSHLSRKLKSEYEELITLTR